MQPGVDEFDRHVLRRFLADHPSSPLGPGYPLGRTLREDGESHRMAWERLLRNDPCAYCGTMGVHGFGGRTVDHIEPRDPLVSARGIGGKLDWTNLISACSGCNERKGARSLLRFLWLRR